VGVPDPHRGLARVLVLVPDGADRPAVVRGQQREPSGTTALVSNPEYIDLFSRLGWGSILVGILLVLLVPFLRRLIKDPSDAVPGTPVAVVPAR
jgi:hypothetical protein